MQEVPVEVGVSNGNYVEIRSGLKDGDTVYAVAKTDSSNTLNGLFSSMFGSQQINSRQRNNQRNNQWNNPGGGGMPSGGAPGGGR